MFDFDYRRFRRLSAKMLLMLLVSQIARIGCRAITVIALAKAFERLGWYNGALTGFIATVLSWGLGYFVTIMMRKRLRFEDDLLETVADIVDSGYEVFVRIKDRVRNWRHA